MTDAKKPWEEQYGGKTEGGGAEPWKQDFGPDAASAPVASRGFKGWAQDIAATAVKGAIGVPEALVGLADIPTGGAVGKFLENEGGAVGFRPKEAKAQVNDWHSDATKEAQRKFQAADGVVDKTITAIQNPSLIATAVGESLPSMGLGGVASRGLMAATKLGQMGAKGAVIAGAAGEGVVGAGSQAEQIRQETQDGLLTPGQTAAALATGVATAGFGYAGGKVAQRLGIGDAETMLAQGIRGVDKQLADTAARAAANPAVADAAVKSIPRKVIEGAIAEGFLEELPQSMAEQIFQNVALGKDWHNELDSAAVMGVLSGGAMGAGAAGFHGLRSPAAAPAGDAVPGTPMPAADATAQPSAGLSRVSNEFAARLQALQEQEQGEPMVPQVAPPDGAAALARQQAQAQTERAAQIEASRAVQSPDDEIYQSTGATAPRPSEVMGLRPGPAAGTLENAAALAVDTGASEQVQQAATLAQAAEEAQKAKPAAKTEQRAPAPDVDPGTGEIAGMSMSEWSDANLSTAFRAAQSKDVRVQLAQELSRRRAQREESALQAELQAELTAPDAPNAPDGAFARVQEDAGAVPEGIQAQGPTGSAPPASGANAEGANVATLAQLNRKQLPDLSNDELQQLVSLLPADHARQKKIQKEVKTRANAAQPAINKGAITDGTETNQAQQGGAQPAQTRAAPVGAAAGEVAGRSPAPAAATAALTDGTAPTANAGAQAAPAAGAQAAPESREQRVHRMDAAGAAWTRMPTAERKAAAARLEGVKPVLQKNLHGAQWENLNGDIKVKLMNLISPVNEAPAPAAPAQAAIESGAKKGVSTAPTWDTMKKGEPITLYRGESSANEVGGQWWTTNKAKAERYGKVQSATVPAEVAAAHAARGHNGADEFVFSGKKPAELVGPAQAAPAENAPDKEGNTIVGRRADGVMIRQDKNGVRFYAQGGVRISETVEMRPTREGMRMSRGELKPDFMTAEESAAESREKSNQAQTDKAQAATENVAKKPADYGASNKLVSQERAAELRDRLKKKLGQLNSGIDPEMLAVGAELAVFHIEAGARKFADFARAMAGDLGTTTAKLKPYLRSWYNGARDMMEDHGLTIEGMDSPDTVRAELAKIGVEAAPESQAQASAPSLSESLLSAIRIGNMPKDNPALKKLVEAFDGKPADPARMKEAQEQLEAAIVSASREIVAKGEGDKSTFDALLRLYESQPNLNVRTSTSIANQAYSTPAPLAYLASQLAGITPQTLTHEPTAGTGMLLIGADPKNAAVNELNDLRVSLLEQQGFTPTQKDAATAPLRDKRGPVDAVITNPPFGSVKDENGKATKVKVDGYNLGQIDHLIAARALETMKDDGRAVLILGANKAPGGLSTDDRIFFNWLYSHYNVVGHFEVEGDLYARQGAGWPVRVITIAGREQSSRISPVAGTVQRVDNWNQVYDQYKQLLDTSGRPVRIAGAVAGRPVEGQAQPAAVPVAAGPQAASADRPGRGERAGGNGNVAGARAGTVSDLTGATTDPVGHEPDEQRLNAQSFVPPRLDEAGQGAKPAPAKRPAKPAGTTAVADAPAEAGNEFQSSYVPRSARKDAGVLIPSNMAQPTQDALNRLEDQVGDIDEFARQELGYDSTEALHNALMGLQVDSVATAIYQIKQGKAVVIADQTGIGKGRQAASVIRWAARNGMTPVFVSVKPSLFTDMYGDLADIGTHDVEPFILNSDAWVSGKDGEKLFSNKASTHRAAIEAIANNGALPAGRNALFMTYSQINTDNAQRRALRALAGNAVFVLDESHNAAGASGTGDFMISVLKEARGVTYLSATYAKRPDNMPLYFKTDIGDAAADSEGLANAMAAGGLPLQTVVSNNLVKAGQMFRRERSYDGVSIASTFDTQNRALHEGMSDTATQALRAIVRADRLFHEIYVKQLQKEIKAEGGDIKDIAGNQAAAGVQHTEFSSVVHNFVRQMLLGLKAQTAADEAIASLKRGEKPIIAVENTMGSFLSEYASSNGLTQGDSLGSFDYRTVLSRALERSRALVETLPTGEEVRRTIHLSGLDPITRKAYDQAQEVIDGLKIAIPVSPIDWMRAEIGRAGFSVAEITGRNLSVDYSEKGKPVLSSIDQAEQRDKVATTRRFNGGELDALILNVAGSTGISLHASEKFQDQRQRHMIVAQAAGDINIFMQMLGRIHRTGQVRLPKYTILSVDLPTEKRPTAVLSKKMKSLNANTSSNTESATSVKTADILNKYGDQIVHQYLQDNMELARQLDVDDIVGGDNPAEDIARKATGRLALQPIAVQNGFYEDVEAQYDTLIEYLNKTNQNDLEPRTFDFDAKETRSEVLFDGPNKETPFGEDAIYGEYSIKAQGTPMTAEEIKATMDTNLGGKTGAEHADALSDALLQTYADQFNLARENAGTSPGTFGIDKYTALMKSAFGDVGVSMAEEAQALISKGMPLPALTPRDMMRAQGVGTGMDFIKSHAIGRIFRVEINSEPFNAVVTNVRNTHKATGNPFSLSKLQLTVSVNGALRSITVPATQFKKIEVSSVAPTFRVEQLFKEQPPNQRETAKIITGNLLAAYGELKGVKGTIISFTKSDGGTEQGILLPKLFDYAKNTQGDYRLRSGAEALNFLQHSENKDIGRFGIATRDGLARVLPYGDGVQVRVPRSKAQGARYFLDKNLIAIAGDFVSTANAMAAKVENPADAAKMLDLLMDKQALYALPSMADEAKAMAPKDAAAEDSVNYEGAGKRRPASAQDKAVMQAIADGKSARDVLRQVASGSKDPFLRQVARMLLKSGITPNLQFGHIGKTAKGDPIHGQYRGKSDTIAMAGSAEYAAERIFMHEAMHAATMRALAKPGLARLQMQKLLAHVQKQKGAAGFYGTKNIDEFVAEVFTNPDFQAALRNMSAPAGSGIKSAWNGFVRILRAILGLPQDANDALSRALELGVAVMREDKALRQRGVRGRGADANAGAAQTDTPEFRRWFGDSKVVDAQGNPLVMYHGTSASEDGGAFTSFDTYASNYGLMGMGGYFTADPAVASSYTSKGKGKTPTVYPVYMSIKNPLDMDAKADTSLWQKYFPDAEAYHEGGDTNESWYRAAEEALREEMVPKWEGAEQMQDGIRAMGFDGVTHIGGGRVNSDGVRHKVFIAFEPEQIKSATGNNGHFDPQDPDIAHFGDADPSTPSAMQSTRAKLGERLNDAFSAPGTLSKWHTTVGSMYNLAEQQPAFKPVFESAKAYIDDISQYAMDAADQAPTIIPRLEDMKDAIPFASKKKPVSAADNKAIAAPIFEGTLNWARDLSGKPVPLETLEKEAATMTAEQKAQRLLRAGEIDPGMLKGWQGMPLESYEKAVNTRYESRILKPGVAWTDAELTSQWGLNERQVALYREYRAAVDRSIDTTTRADILRFGGKQLESLRGMVMDAANMDDALQLVESAARAEMAADPDSAQAWGDVMQGAVERVERARELQKRGYAPLQRFGEYTVDVVTDGERKFFSLYETKAEANAAAKVMREEYGATNVAQGTLSKEEHKMLAGVTPESLELFGNMLGLASEGDAAQDKVFQEFLRRTKSNNSALKRLIHRKGIAGFSEDVGRGLASFIYSNARLTSGGLNVGSLTEAAAAIPKGQGQLRDAAERLRQHVLEPQEAGASVRGFMFAQYLGGSVASALVNLTQPMATTLPYLSQFGGASKAAQALLKASKDMATRGLQYEKDLADALKRAEDSGTVSPQEIHYLMGQARGQSVLRAGGDTKASVAQAMASNAWARTKLGWGLMFGAAEQVNRRMTFIAAYRLAKAQGMDNPEAFATKAVDETQFVQNKANKMEWGRSTAGGALMTFKGYSIAYLELMHRMWTQGGPEGKRAVLLAAGTLMLLGGAGGLPFMEDAEDIATGMGRMLGYNWNAKKARQDFLADVFGRQFAQFADKGLSGLPGAPIDVSGRLGMGNLIPGTGLLLDKTNNSRDYMELLGPAGDFVSRVVDGGKQVLGGAVSGDAGKVARGALNVAPTAVRNLAKGADMAQSGQYKDTRGNKVMDVTAAEAMAKAIGFQPNSVADAQEANALRQDAKNFYALKRSQITAMWAGGVSEKDAAKVQQARDAIADWNRKNPDQPMLVRIPDVMRRVKEMNKTKEQRILDSAPKAMKAQIREDIARAAMLG